MGKCNKTHLVGRTWEIGNHTFPIIYNMGTFFSSNPHMLWYTSSYGKCMGFPINFPQYGKMQQNPSYEETWEIGNHTFPIVWVLFSHLMVYASSYGKCMGFFITFPQYGKMQQKPSYAEDLGNWYSYFPHSMGAFFPFDSQRGILHYMGNTWVFPLISHNGKIQQNPSHGEDLGNQYSYFSHSMGNYLYSVTTSLAGQLKLVGLQQAWYLKVNVIPSVAQLPQARTRYSHDSTKLGLVQGRAQVAALAYMHHEMI